MPRCTPSLFTAALCHSQIQGLLRLECQFRSSFCFLDLGFLPPQVWIRLGALCCSCFRPFSELFVYTSMDCVFSLACRLSSSRPQRMPRQCKAISVGLGFRVSLVLDPLLTAGDARGESFGWAFACTGQVSKLKGVLWYCS